MKITRRKRITIREREIVLTGNPLTEMDAHFCPLCNAPIQPRELPVERITGLSIDEQTSLDKRTK